MTEEPSPSAPPPPVEALPATVARELRPAAKLWLCTWIGLGIWNLLWAKVHALHELAAGEAFWHVWYLIFAVMVGVFVFGDREARRVFARPRRSAVELCLLVGIVAWLIDYQWVAWLYRGTDMMQGDLSTGEIWLGLFWMALMPALFEEWAFRGLTLDRLRRVLPLEWAIIGQALMFALLHLDTYMFFGVVAGILRVVAGALWPCMLWHFAWNAALIIWPEGLL